MPTADSTRRDRLWRAGLGRAWQDRAGQAGQRHSCRFTRSLIRSLIRLSSRAAADPRQLRSAQVTDRPERWGAYLEACWGQPLASSNLASSATLARETLIGGVGRLAFRDPLVSVLSAQHHLHGDSPQLFYQVTGVADVPEQEAARRRSVHLAVQGWPRSSATGRIPADVQTHHVGHPGVQYSPAAARAGVRECRLA